MPDLELTKFMDDKMSNAMEHVKEQAWDQAEAKLGVFTHFLQSFLPILLQYVASGARNTSKTHAN